MLVNKHGADLDLMQQRDLARWAVMKVLLMEHVMRQKHPLLRAAAGYVPSEPELAWLMAEACPPSRSRIWPVKQPVVHWPPTRHLSPAVFGKVVNWGR